MKTEVLVYGSSPNAFSAGLTLAAAGKQVTLVETSRDFGAPYFSQPSGELGLALTHFCPELSRRFGLQVESLQHAARSGLDTSGRFLRLTPEGLGGEARARDRDRWPGFVKLMEQAASLLRQLEGSEPDLLQAWRGLGRRQSMEVMRLPWTSLRDLLDEWFEDDLLKGILAETALEGVAQGPFACGTTFHLLRRWSRGEVLTPRVVAGGSSQLIEALRGRADAAGIRVAHWPGHPTLDLEKNLFILDGQSIEFQVLLSSKDVRWTYQQLVSPRYLETEFNTAVHRVRGRGLWTRALGDLSWPTSWPEELQKDVLHLQSGLCALERCWDEVKRHRFPERAPAVFRWPGFLDASFPGDRVELGSPLRSGLARRGAQASALSILPRMLLRALLFFS